MFQSILFDGGESRAGQVTPVAPACFPDLNLDQVVASITAGREEYDLAPFFYAPLQDARGIEYRHDVFRDLESLALIECIRSFARSMQAMSAQLAQASKLHYRRQQQAWFLDAVGTYCDAVTSLAKDLARVELGSHGFQTFREYVRDYVEFAGFTSLVAETKQLRTDLSGVKYRLHIKGSRVTVDRSDSEADYSAEVENTFQKFRQGAVKDYRLKLSNPAEMNHIEANVLEMVARLFPDLFLRLEEYCDHHGDYLDDRLGAFDREVQFYIAYLEYIERLKAAGLPFCFPRVSDQSKEVHAQGTFDLALANKLVGTNVPVVCNDFYLEGQERLIVVTGPNQGGKTTFARTFGQMHYLASIGCLVPGSDARLFLCDQLFTHFEWEEDLANLRGKLEDELVRVHEILEQATPNSVLIMNESFTATTLDDAILLGTKVMRRILQLGMLCVCVTFVDELASLDKAVASMAATVDPENPALRTYKLVRKPADGLAYAMAIAEKYGLTYERLNERISS